MSHLETIGGLKAFLGSCVYLSQFIKDYAMITAPLYALEASQTTKTNKIRHSGDNANWTALHQRAFKTLKAALATAPCLAFPAWSRPFIVSSDCSKYQMGGALLQLDKDGRERIHVIALTLKRLNTSQVKWRVTSKESAALIHCMKKFRGYVHRHPTVCLPGHTALLSVMSGQEFATEQLNRMSLELMEYAIHLCYRPGKLLDLADLTSRGRIEDDSTKREEMVNELLEWRAKQEIKKLNVDDADQVITKRLKPDDIIGETPMAEDRPPHLQSPAEREQCKIHVHTHSMSTATNSWRNVSTS